jgi:hypothetical protein
MTPEEERDYHEAVWRIAMTNMSSSKQQSTYIVLRRRETPGLGKEMERLSIDGCKEIARKGNFGFYPGDQGYGLSVWAYGYLRLNRLQ